MRRGYSTAIFEWGAPASAVQRGVPGTPTLPRSSPAAASRASLPRPSHVAPLQALPRLRSSHVAYILSPALLRCLINALESNQERMLKPVANATSESRGAQTTDA